MKNRLAAESGFSLIEVIVALVILAALSLLTSQAMRSGIQQRTFLTADLDRDAKLADALRIIRNDVASAFHHRDIFVTMMNEAMAPEQKKPPEGGRPPPQPEPGPPPGFIDSPGEDGDGPGPRPTPAIVTGFVGDSESMYFTTLSNVRTMRDAKESDQAKVGYYVKSCSTRKSNSGDKRTSASRCLYRSITPFLDKEVTQPGPETVLLENVEEFQLRYLGPGREDYVESWKTGEGGDAISKDNFPYAVEITLTTHNKNDPKDKPATATILAPIRFPNNPAKKNNQENQGELGP